MGGACIVVGILRWCGRDSIPPSLPSSLRAHPIHGRIVGLVPTRNVVLAHLVVDWIPRTVSY